MTRLGLWHYPVDCQCNVPGEIDANWHCVCDGDEKMVRARVNGVDIPDLLPDERASLAVEAEMCSNGAYAFDDCIVLDGELLCYTVLDAWFMVAESDARKHGLI